MPYENTKICYICTEIFVDKHAKDKVMVPCHLPENIEMLHAEYVI